MSVQIHWWHETFLRRMSLKINSWQRSESSRKMNIINYFKIIGKCLHGSILQGKVIVRFVWRKLPRHLSLGTFIFCSQQKTVVRLQSVNEKQNEWTAKRYLQSWKCIPVWVWSELSHRMFHFSMDTQETNIYYLQGNNHTLIYFRFPFITLRIIV